MLGHSQRAVALRYQDLDLHFEKTNYYGALEKYEQALSEYKIAFGEEATAEAKTLVADMIDWLHVLAGDMEDNERLQQRKQSPT